MLKKLKVERFHFNDKFTIGKLFIDDEDVKIYTLEDTVREIKGKPVSEWKIDGVTAIPSGIYKIEFRYSPKFKKVLPHLIDVEGFEYILIHCGNTDKDTEGCILLGLTWDGSSDFIGSSKLAFEKFSAMIEGCDLEIQIL